MERLIESHLRYRAGKHLCPPIFLYVLQIKSCTSLFLYRILGCLMFIALISKDCVSQTVLAAHQCLFPCDIFITLSVTMQTNYFLLHLQVNRNSNVSLCRLRQVISICLLCSCEEPVLSHCLVYVGSRFHLCHGEDSLWVFAQSAHFYNLFPPTTRTYCHETFSYSYNFECVLCFSQWNTSYLYSGVHSQGKLSTQRNTFV